MVNSGTHTREPLPPDLLVEPTPLLTAAMFVVLDTVAPCAIVPVAVVLAIVISLTIAFVVAAVACRDHAGGGE